MNHRADGFTLIEVTIAMCVLVVGAVSLVQLALLARQSNQTAALGTIAVVLAQGKMEQLRAAEWPGGAQTGCCEFFDAEGAQLAGAGTAPVGAEFVRGWSIEPLAAMPDSALGLHVWVSRRGASAVRLVSVRARRIR